MLTEEDRRYLLEIAHRSLIEAAAGRRYQPEGPHPDRLMVPAAAFVTLWQRDGALRGCIGQVEAVMPLVSSIARMAYSASQEDPRFPPVAPVEVPGLRVDISVLTSPEPLDAEAVEVGTHGLIVEQGLRRGLLLPQVASERGWDSETFLDHTCLKAGLPRDAWRDRSTRILGFTAEVFGDDEH